MLRNSVVELAVDGGQKLEEFELPVARTARRDEAGEARLGAAPGLRRASRARARRRARSADQPCGRAWRFLLVTTMMASPSPPTRNPPSMV